MATFACACNTLRVLLRWKTFALDTRGHFVSLDLLEDKQHQGEGDLGGLHLGCKCLTLADTGVPSEKVLE